MSSSTKNSPIQGLDCASAPAKVSIDEKKHRLGCAGTNLTSSLNRRIAASVAVVTSVNSGCHVEQAQILTDLGHGAIPGV